MTSKRTIEKRIAELERQRERQQASATEEMSAEEAARIETHCEAMIDGLSSERQAALEQATHQIEEESEDAAPGEVGRTDGQLSYLRILGGGPILHRN